MSRLTLPFIAGIALVSIGSACIAQDVLEDNELFSVHRFTSYVSTDAAWADDGHTIFYAPKRDCLLINIDTGVSNTVASENFYNSVWPCADGTKLIVQQFSGVRWIDSTKRNSKQFSIDAENTTIAAINTSGRRAIINSKAGSGIYDLETGSLVTQISSKTGFWALNFDKSDPNILYGFDTHYGYVIWDIAQDNVTGMMSEQQLLQARIGDAVEPLLLPKDVNITQHLRYVCRLDEQGPYMLDKQTCARTPLGWIQQPLSVLKPNASGTRLIVLHDTELSVIDIASRKTIYVWKPMP